MRARVPPRRWLLRGILAVAIALLLGAATAQVLAFERTTLGPGTIESPAGGETVVSVQGFHFQGQGNQKKPARLVSVAPGGDTNWVYNGGQTGAVWFYDVDPLENGNLLVTSTIPGDTLVYELDPETKERVWQVRFDAEDTHDVDLINGDQLLVANMRNVNESAGVSNDRLFVYDIEREEIVWEWQFRDHFPRDGGGNYNGDWTHVNDVDKIGEGEYMASVRNFDQAIVVDRETNNVTMRLGEDGNHDVLFEQHNPDYLESENGNPTILVADSEQDRVVEYEREHGEWNRTWELTGRLSWPRDADRLPDGNTLITDTLHHRVIEVTPQGEVVWEYYAAWAPYDAERIRYGGGSNGPTIADTNATGRYVVEDGARNGPEAERGVGQWLVRLGFQDLGERYAHIVPFVRPVWVPSWAFATSVVAGLLLVGWVTGELVYQRRRVRRLVGGLGDRIRSVGGG
jgi:hypothetical protein